MNYGSRFIEQRDDTRDSINQIFLRLWDKHHRLPAVDNVRSYLLTSLKREIFTRNKSTGLEIRRNQRFHQISEGEQPSFEESLIRFQEKQEVIEKIKKAFSHLTEREKELIRLRFFEDLGYEEIALQCRISKRTAYNIIHAGLNTLRKHLISDERGNLFLVASVSYVVFCLSHLSGLQDF